MNNSASPAHVSVVPSVVPPYDRTAIIPELKTLMSDIFEHGESLPDQVYKDMLDNCARVQRSIGQLVQSAASPVSDDELRARGYVLLPQWYTHDAREARVLSMLNINLEQRLTMMKRQQQITENENKRLLRRIEENSVPALPSAPSVCCFKALQAAFERDPSIKAKTSRCSCCRRNYLIGYGGQNFRNEGMKHHRETCGHTFKHCELCKRQIRRDRAARGLPDPDTGVPYASSRL